MVRHRIPAFLFITVLASNAFGQVTLVGHYFNHADPLRITDVVAAPEIDRVFAVTQPNSALFLGWRLSTFPADVQANHEPLLPPILAVDPTDPGSGWSYVQADGAGLVSFDYDTRGNIYLSYGINGFGIVTRIAVAGDRAAVTNNDIRFYDVPALLTGGAPLQVITGTQYSRVVTDGTRFFASAVGVVSGHVQTTLTMFTPAGATYLQSTTTIIDRVPFALHYGGGAVALTLRSLSSQGSAVLYTVEGGVLVPHSLNLPTVPLDAVDVFVLGAQHYLVTTAHVTGELYTLSAAIFASVGTDIPTTSEWGLLAILLTLSAIAVTRLRA